MEVCFYLKIWHLSGSYRLFLRLRLVYMPFYSFSLKNESRIKKRLSGDYWGEYLMESALFSLCAQPKSQRTKKASLYFPSFQSLLLSPAISGVDSCTMNMSTGEQTLFAYLEYLSPVSNRIKSSTTSDHFSQLLIKLR